MQFFKSAVNNISHKFNSTICALYFESEVYQQTVDKGWHGMAVLSNAASID